MSEISELLPHKEPMVLINEIVRLDNTQAVSRVHIGPKSLFLIESAVPAWVGIEYMAQTMALYSGNISRTNSEEIGLGFLLGARKYNSRRSHFLLGETLDVRVEPQVIDGPISNFNCSIHIDSKLVAEAAITAFKPTKEMLEELQS